MTEPAATGSLPPSAVADLVDQAGQAADAWIRGDIERYLELTTHAPGFTLAAPDGGPPRQYPDRERTFAGWQSPFADGESTLEVTAVHAWDDTAVLVAIERQHGRVGAAPDRDLSLRVTEVYRRTSVGWLLVHRHADPLVRAVPIEQIFALVDG
jgi:ketosteroid isomerase-like protein